MPPPPQKKKKFMLVMCICAHGKWYNAIIASFKSEDAGNTDPRTEA